MNENIECLCNLGFTKLEAQIYLTLLEGGRQSGYQIAKRINISRSSVYSALDHMFERGVVLLQSEDVQIYSAQNPKSLFNRLKDEFLENAVTAYNALQPYYEEPLDERFTNIKGYDTVVSNCKELLSKAEKEVYINTDFDLHLFENEINMLRAKNVRIIVFSFATLNHDGLDIEFFTHNDFTCNDDMPSRMMLVIDVNTTLVADTLKDRGIWFGTITNNALMVSIISEHIHNNI